MRLFGSLLFASTLSHADLRDKDFSFRFSFPKREASIVHRVSALAFRLFYKSDRLSMSIYREKENLSSERDKLR